MLSLMGRAASFFMSSTGQAAGSILQMSPTPSPSAPRSPSPAAAVSPSALASAFASAPSASASRVAPASALAPTLTWANPVTGIAPSAAMRSPMQLFFIDASYASPSTSDDVNTENYWRFPPIGNAGGLYHAKFQTINKQKITVLGELLSLLQFY